MMKLMPLVYTKLAKLQGKALRTCLFSDYECKGDDLELTTRSDEAIIYWFFEAYFENDWKHNITTDLAKMNNPRCEPANQRPNEPNGKVAHMRPKIWLRTTTIGGTRLP
jgi:hypothetical protein